MPYTPGLPGWFGEPEALEPLTLREPLSLQLEIVLKQVSSLGNGPAWLALQGCLCGLSWMTVPTATFLVNPSPFS